ncbi:SMI1/KNR4 family protein [Tahibacter caeni]|uniref:SMI1/KNR4 family protein n=1 Tax=Tahibacter caeni TaxID=1453545 RepID=UPI00214747D0|nr:SMI1/KNR4 family protein [Tahibacter caeni]
MTTQELMQQFDAQWSGDWAASETRATPASIRRISEHFGITLPPLLVALARSSHYFTRYFASLGRDYDDPGHIIRINSHWRRRRRTRRVPRGLLILNHSYDDDYWCLDAAATCEPGAYPVYYWAPPPTNHPAGTRLLERYHADFDECLRFIVSATRCGTRASTARS